MKEAKAFKVRVENGVLKPLEPLAGLEEGRTYTALLFVPAQYDLSEVESNLTGYKAEEEFQFQRFRGVLPDEGEDEELLVKMGFSK